MFGLLFVYLFFIRVRRLQCDDSGGGGDSNGDDDDGGGSREPRFTFHLVGLLRFYLFRSFVRFICSGPWFTFSFYYAYGVSLPLYICAVRFLSFLIFVYY